MIKYFGDGRAFDVEIEHAQESSPARMAGAEFVDFAPQHPLLISNGDVPSGIRWR